jgi:hypothetical protein
MGHTSCNEQKTSPSSPRVGFGSRRALEKALTFMFRITQEGVRAWLLFGPLPPTTTTCELVVFSMADPI